MTCYCDLLTPQRILDEQNIDVFEQIIDDSVYEYTMKRATLWSTYRYRFIGSCDLTAWIQVMQDRAMLIDREYNMKLVAFDMLYTQVDTDGPDFSESSYEADTQTEREDTPDTEYNEAHRFLADRSTTKMTGKNYNGLQTKTVRDWMDGVARDPIRDYANEFQDLFMYC